MTRQDFEDILAGPQDLNQENLYNLLEFSRKEKIMVEFKEEFDRENSGKIKIIDFAKVIIGFMNSDNDTSTVIYGIRNEILKSTTEKVTEFVHGHNLMGAKPEDLIGYIRERVWPAELYLIRIKQLMLRENSAITSIYIGRGKSKPYLYYSPNNPGNGIRSFNRSSATTYEMEAPMLHQFIQSLPKIANLEELKDKSDISVVENELNSILKENFEHCSKLFYNPKEFGLYTLIVMPEKQINITDEEIKNILNPTHSPMTKVMEELGYCDSIQVTPKWYYRILIPRAIISETKANWMITCYRKKGIFIINSLIDEYLKGEKHLNPFHFSYEIQRLLQMAKVLFKDKVQNIKLVVDFRFIETFGYPKYRFSNIEKIYPYVGDYNPLTHIVDFKDVQLDDKGDLLSPAVKNCLDEVVKIFGLDGIPNQLTTEGGEMIFVQSFKGQR